MTCWAVVLAGGVGSRFWPISTPDRPKQLLPLATTEPMLADALARLAPLVPPERTLILTNAGLVEPIAALAPTLPRENLIAEPRPAGTAAALAWAAHEIARRGARDDVMLSVHADWAIGDADAFRTALLAAAQVAESQRALVTVGVVPVRPDPGFGYIQPGDAVGPVARRVARFVEKPDRARAETMMREGYLWNSGIFVWRAGDFLDEIAALTPEIAPHLEAHPDDLESFFAAITTGISVDVGVMERSARVLVLPGDFGWDDVGTWAALRRVRRCDERGNALSGVVHALEATNNVVHADGSAVVLYGVSDLVVVSRDGLTLVTTTERAADLKQLIESLPSTLREQS
ncbi:MAG TPA: sugar phosphate nucleotidyltransferase [Gemmatimonadaceae bacterium]|jgi:mannose-1-phosphate guanylyltransferase|nr:sugar phosphate nucleotidyltransferase [Gemmatimonadaceae bacterium]